MTNYPIEIFWSDEDEGYIAVVPDLPGCNAWGKTEADAIREAHDAIAAWVKAARNMKRPIPKPSRPADELAYSGKFLMRVPKRLHAEMVHAAKAQGVRPFVTGRPLTPLGCFWVSRRSYYSILRCALPAAASIRPTACLKSEACSQYATVAI